MFQVQLVFTTTLSSVSFSLFVLYTTQRRGQPVRWFKQQLFNRDTVMKQMKADPGAPYTSTLQSKYHTRWMSIVLAELKSQKQELVPCPFSASGWQCLRHFSNLFQSRTRPKPTYLACVSWVLVSYLTIPFLTVNLIISS